MPNCQKIAAPCLTSDMASLMLSFVIPAHNEEQHIGPTVAAATAAAQGIGEPFDIIVVDDASTDKTASIAARDGHPGESILWHQAAGPVTHRKAWVKACPLRR